MAADLFFQARQKKPAMQASLSRKRAGQGRPYTMKHMDVRE